MLGGFRLFAGDDQIAVCNGTERLLAFLGLDCQLVSRHLMAAILWPDVPERRAHASLRSALARLDGTGKRILHITTNEMRLTPDTEVDFRRAKALAQRILDPATPVAADDLGTHAVDLLSHDLLPGWYDDWVLAPGAEWRQLRLHALEALSRLFLESGRHADAVAAACVAAHADPLRESACAALIRAHLAEGNQAEALRRFEVYERGLHQELGLRPTSRIQQLIAQLRGR